MIYSCKGLCDEKLVYRCHLWWPRVWYVHCAYVWFDT